MTFRRSTFRIRLISLLLVGALLVAQRPAQAQTLGLFTNWCDLQNPLGNPLCPFPLPWFIIVNIVVKTLVPMLVGPVLTSVFQNPEEAISAFQQSGFIKPYFRYVDSRNSGWQDTGIDIPSGAYVIFKPSGQVQYKYGSNGAPVTIGPGGGDVALGSLAPLAVPNSMVFKVGEAGLPFSVITPILQSSAYPILFGGRLYLGMNDCAGCYGDNAGSWPVEVHVPSTSPDVFAKAPDATWSGGAVGIPIAGLTAIEPFPSEVTTIEYELNGMAGTLPVGPSDAESPEPSPVLGVTQDGWHQLWYRARSVDGSASQWKFMQFGIDDTPPSIAVHTSPVPNGSNWYTGPVQVSFTCSDAGSGVASCPAAFTLYSSASGTVHATDNSGKAGTATYTVNIDGEAPVTTIAPASALSNWLNGGSILTLSAYDTVSGVQRIHWRLNGGPVQTGTQVVLGAEGTHTIEYWSVDYADNAESVRSVTVRVDTTAPTITGTLDRAPDAQGWYGAPVTATFTCSDAGSGVASCAAPALFDAEGSAQAKAGTARDHAGNEASATVSGVHVDLTAPFISVAADRAPNADGWYNAPVTASFTCSDALSGIESCPAPSTIDVSSAGQQRDGTARDLAGHESTAALTGINIDMVQPATTITPPSALAGWLNTDAILSLSGDDALSGVQQTYWRVNGGPAQTGTQVTIGAEGTHVVDYWSADYAGNVETPHTVTVRVDKTAPEIAGALDRAPNDGGWYNAPVTATFTCSDAGSGIASCAERAVFDAEGSAQAKTGTARDHAGNEASAALTGVNIDLAAPLTTIAPVSALDGWRNADAVLTLSAGDTASGVQHTYWRVNGGPVQTGTQIVLSAEGTYAIEYWSVDKADNVEAAHTATARVDKTLPSISAALDRAPNANGWYNRPVTASFTCSDALSGIASCPADATVGDSGANQQRGGTARDVAGNEATATLGGINVDLVAPATSAALSSPPNADGWHATDVAVTLAAQDAHSGVARTEFQIGGAAWLPYLGPIALTADGVYIVGYRSIDRAGNVEGGSVIEVWVDKTAPEAFLQFNPASREVEFLGRDAGRLLSAAPVSPASVVAAGRGESRTYAVTDRAGNTLAMSLDVLRDGQNVKAWIRDLSYNGRATPLPPNALHFTWTPDKSGLTRNVQTKLTIGPEGAEQALSASYNAQQDRTVITEGGVTAAIPGFVQLRMGTVGGALRFERP